MKASIGCALAAMLVCTTATLHGQSGWKDLNGEPVPEIVANSWLNAQEKVSINDLKGKVWLLEFFATW